MRKVIAIGALLSAMTQVPAHAQDAGSLLSNIDFSLTGYGTAGTVVTSTDSAEFIRGNEASGATSSPAENVDSNLGVQATARFNSWLAATVQAEYTKDALTGVVPWAYVKLDPLDSLSLKLGRVEMPIFAISDSLDVGYANVWLRPPQEVYALANLKELNGAELSYSLPMAGTHVTVTAYAGDTVIWTQRYAQMNGNDARGGELKWDTQWVTLRAGWAQAHVDGNILIENIPVGPIPTPLGNVTAYVPYNYYVEDIYSFEGFGALVDHNNIIAQAEWVKRYSQNYAGTVNATGWYVLGGYRFGTVAPYVSYAKTVKDHGDGYTASGTLSDDQNTTAVGVRWDAFKSADIKLQAEHVNPEGTGGVSFAFINSPLGLLPATPSGSVNVFSLTVDFIF
jgi:hypothetical protein